MWDAALGVTLNGTDVSALASQVPGAVDLLQATAANQPLYTGAPTYNGQPSVQFVLANADSLLAANIDLIGTGAHTYMSAHRVRAIAAGVYNGIMGNARAGAGSSLNAETTTGLRNLLFVGNSDHAMGSTPTTVPEMWSIGSGGSGSGIVIGMVYGVAQSMSSQLGSWAAPGATGSVFLGASPATGGSDMDWLFGALFTTLLPNAVAIRIHKAGCARLGLLA